jgi:hypothetical protein
MKAVCTASCAGSNMESACKFSCDGSCGDGMVYRDLCGKHDQDTTRIVSVTCDCKRWAAVTGYHGPWSKRLAAIDSIGQVFCCGYCRGAPAEVAEGTCGNMTVCGKCRENHDPNMFVENAPDADAPDEDSDAVAPDAPGSDSDDEDGYHSDDPDQRDRYCGICRTTSMKRHYTSSAQVVLPSGETKQVYFPVCNDCY